jgi:hypothetical protein
MGAMASRTTRASKDPIASMTAYVDTDGETVAVLAELGGKARVFAAELREQPKRRAYRPRGSGRAIGSVARLPAADPAAPAPPAAARAEAWAREGQPCRVVWRTPRLVRELAGLSVLDSAMRAISSQVEARPSRAIRPKS